LAVTVCILSAAHARSAFGQDRCAARKVGVAGKATTRMIHCAAKALRQGNAVSAACLNKSGAALAAGFAKAEGRPPCRTTADAPAIDPKIRAFVDETVAAQSPSPDARCAAAKIGATGLVTGRLLKCHAKAFKKGRGVDPACLAKAESKLVAAFARAEAPGGCLAVGDAAAMALKMRAVTAELVTDLVPLKQGCIGSCLGGAYCESAQCPRAVCYASDALASLLMCGGAVDSCCGFGSCQGDSYCDVRPPSCTATCLAPSAPLSQVICNDAFEAGCGVGTCAPNGAYCDDCMCYPPESATSQAFCACLQACGEHTPGCGVGTCYAGSYCDDCACHPAGSLTAMECCPGGFGSFQRVYQRPQGDGSDHTLGGLTTSDGGYVATGYSGRILRTDHEGNLLWAKMIVGLEDLTGIAETGDGFVVAGGYEFLTKLDGDGNGLWQKSLPGPAKSVLLASDGGFIVAGWLWVTDDVDTDAYLLKTDAAGNFEWSWRYGGPGLDMAESVLETAGGFLALGSTTSFGAGLDDLLLFHTDGVGSLQWAKTVGGPAYEAPFTPQGSGLPFQLKATADGGYILATIWDASTLGADALVVKLDANVEVTWAKRYDGGNVDLANAVAESAQGYFVIGTGTTGQAYGSRRALMLLDPAGDPIWTRGYGPDQFAGFVTGGAAADGGAYLLTEIHPHMAGIPLFHRFHIIKTDPDGLTRGCRNVQNLVMTAITEPFTAQLQPVAAVALPDTMQDVTPNVVDYELVESTLCASSASYLCRGITAGALCAE
jgi:hypothetical protein